ncbi:UNVERIFIED_CONTAM: hypothetical protein PYX00_011389 [Menopon gallinae]|uniref:Uncharacterized protein n=1 Tax=Menopon gallinae TaxID=328185 RepID=A0AAW2H7I0_9NEOP
MENFFVRSVAHMPIHTKFLWSDGPTYFQVFERGFLLLERTNIIVLDRLGREELMGTLESPPLLVSFCADESLLLVVLKGKCLLLNSYFELVGTLSTPSDVLSVEWNPHAHLIYCATEHTLLILSNHLELLKEVHYGGPVALRTANVLAVACNGRVHFVEKNGLEFGSPLVLSEPCGGPGGGKGPAGVVSHLRFLDRNTLITVGDHLTLYSSRNDKWYKKLQWETRGSFLGIVKNTLYFECEGIVSIKVFKEFTRSAGMFFVVDGSSLFLYNYWKAIVPPPFYERALELPGNICDVSACNGRVAVLTGLCGAGPVRKHEDRHLGESSIGSERVVGGHTLSLNVYRVEDLALEHSVDVSSFREGILEILLLEEVVWIRLETRVCSVDISTGKVDASLKVSGVLRMYFFGSIVLLDDRRRLQSLDEKHGVHTVLNLSHCCSEQVGEILYCDVQVCKEAYFVQLNSQLFCGSVLIDGVVSFLIHSDFLIVTKHDSLHFARLENTMLQKAPAECRTPCLEAYALSDSLCQDECSGLCKAQSLERVAVRSESLVAERNSVILAYTSLLILYIPRGNIEAFSLRPVVVESVREHIQSGRYREAVGVCAVNCIPFDIWIGMKMDISRVVASVSRGHVIMLFAELLSLLKLGSLDADSILRFLTMRDVVVGVERVGLSEGCALRAPPACQAADHEEACVITLHWSTDPLFLLGCLLRAVDNAVLVEILARVGVLPAALAVADSLEDAVKAAVCHTTPDNLIKQSLLLHNMDLSSRIALILDKRDYLHEIQQMRGGNEKFKVFDYLGMHRKALDCLFEKHVSEKRQCSTEVCSPAKAPETRHTDDCLAPALAYADKHDLYEYSMKYDHPRFIEGYAEKMFRCRNYEKSFELYKRVDLEKALDVSFSLESRFSIEVASQLNVLDAKFYRRLVESLAQRGHWEEAARLQRDVLKENAMSYFLRSGNMLESLLEFAKYARRHMESVQCTCPGRNAAAGPEMQAKCASVSGVLDTYGGMLFDSPCIREDSRYREFAAKVKEMEQREIDVLDRKARQVEKCLQKMRCIEGEPCAASETTFSYTVSGRSVRMSEEEFVQKRLSALKKAVSDLRTDEIADILERMGLVTDLRTKYSSVVKNIEDAANMAALIIDDNLDICDQISSILDDGDATQKLDESTLDACEYTSAVNERSTAFNADESLCRRESSVADCTENGVASASLNNDAEKSAETAKDEVPKPESKGSEALKCTDAQRFSYKLPTLKNLFQPPYAIRKPSFLTRNVDARGDADRGGHSDGLSNEEFEKRVLGQLPAIIQKLCDENANFRLLNQNQELEIERLVAKRESLCKRVEECEEEKGNIMAELKKLNADYSKLVEDMEQNDAYKKEIENYLVILKEEHENMRSKQSEMSESSKKLQEEKSILETRVLKCEKESAELADKNSRLEGELDAYNARLASLEEKKAYMESQASAFEKGLSAITQRCCSRLLELQDRVSFIGSESARRVTTIRSLVHKNEQSARLAAELGEQARACESSSLVLRTRIEQSSIRSKRAVSLLVDLADGLRFTRACAAGLDEGVKRLRCQYMEKETALCAAKRCSCRLSSLLVVARDKLKGQIASELKGVQLSMKQIKKCVQKAWGREVQERARMREAHHNEIQQLKGHYTVKIRKIYKHYKDRRQKTAEMQEEPDDEDVWNVFQ